MMTKEEFIQEVEQVAKEIGFSLKEALADYKNKVPYNRQKALDVIDAYYMAKGYSKEHCRGWYYGLPDWNIQDIYEIICEELQDEKEQ